jgi:hypothetical protein
MKEQIEPADGSPLEASTTTQPAKRLPTSVHVWFWLFFAAWVVSFFLPAVRLDYVLGRPQAARCWDLVETSLVLSFVPVKGMWLIFFPHVWLVWINLFMPIKSLACGECGRLDCHNLGIQRWGSERNGDVH